MQESNKRDNQMVTVHNYFSHNRQYLTCKKTLNPLQMGWLRCAADTQTRVANQYLNWLESFNVFRRDCKVCDTVEDKSHNLKALRADSPKKQAAAVDKLHFVSRQKFQSSHSPHTQNDTPIIPLHQHVLLLQKTTKQVKYSWVSCLLILQWSWSLTVCKWKMSQLSNQKKTYAKS